MVQIVTFIKNKLKISLIIDKNWVIRACFSEEIKIVSILSFHSIYQNVPTSLNFWHLSDVVMMHIGLGTRLILYLLHYQTPCSHITNSINKFNLVLVFSGQNSSKNTSLLFMRHPVHTQVYTYDSSLCFPPWPAIAPFGLPNPINSCSSIKSKATFITIEGLRPYGPFHSYEIPDISCWNLQFSGISIIFQ